MFEIVLFVLAFALLFHHLKDKKKYKNYPPGPVGLPVIGYIPIFGRNPADNYVRLADKYGPVFSVYQGFKDWVILNDLPSIREAFSKQGRFTSARQSDAALLPIFTGVNNIFLTDGPVWKSNRTVALKFLKNFNKEAIEEKICEEAEYLCEEMKRHCGKPMEDHIILAKAVTNVMMYILYGNRFEYDDERLDKMLDLILQLSSEYDGDVVGLLLIAPFTRHFPILKKSFGKLKRKSEDMKAVVMKLINEHRKVYNESNKKENFVDHCITQLNEGKSPDGFSDLRIMASAMDMTAAAADTTANTIRWCLFTMMLYPQIQEKMSDELRNVVGPTDKITMAHQMKMPYVRAFIQEIMRYHIPVPLAVAHQVTAEVSIAGFKIPEKTRIVANIWAVHRDPKLFENPNEFLPERFLDCEGNFIPCDHMIPFSIGNRQCIGEKSARMMLFVFLANLVQKFKFTESKERPLPSFDSGVFSLSYSPRNLAIEFQEI